MPVPFLLFCCLCTAAAEQGPNEFPIAMTTDVRTLDDGGWLVQVNHRDRMDKPGDAPAPARVRAYVPAGPEPIRLVLFDLGATYTSDRSDLQAIARAERWAIVGCLLRYQQGTELFLAAMDEIAQRTGRAELRTAPIIPFGFSRNGARAWTFLAENRERTLALCLGGNPGISARFAKNPAQRELADVTPALTLVGSRDPFVDYDKARERHWHLAHYPKIRALDIPWGMMIGWGYGHDWEGSWGMFVLFAQEASRLRMAGPGGPLRPLRFGDGWLVESGWETAWPQAAPVATYAGDRAATVWLPSEAMVVPWRGFNVQAPQVVLTLDGDALRAEPPPDTTSVEFHDRGTRIGTATAAPWRLAGADLAGVRTLTAVAVLPDGARTPSRPLTVVDGRAIDWAVGAAEAKAAESPANQIRLTPELRQVLAAARAAKTAGGPAPAPEALAALRTALAEAERSEHVEQRTAAAKLLADLP